MKNESRIYTYLLGILFVAIIVLMAGPAASTITADNSDPGTDTFPDTVTSAVYSIALISDGDELVDVTPILDEMGLTYDVLNNNWDGVQGIYTSDLTFLNNYGLVIWYASGTGAGRLTTQDEHDALESFIGNGGHLLVTGYDTIGSPTDALLADLIRSSGSGDGPMTVDYTTTNDNHPITAGPYGYFPVGTALTANTTDHDQAEADTARGH